LLHYSSEFGESTKQLFIQKRAGAAIRKITDILAKPEEALKESIIAFHKDYQTIDFFRNWTKYGTKLNLLNLEIYEI